jgi:beta-mannosidase
MTDLPTAVPLRTDLGQGWVLSATGGPVPDMVDGVQVPATVPGCVHTDLFAAGLIPDPYLDDNERLLAWIGASDWTYRTTFTAPGPGADRTDLVFEGLDTVATVTLNGTLVASTANMHRSYRFDVTRHLRPGDNTLEVAFASPVRYADAASLALEYRPHVNPHPFNAIRKMACSFGWDWGLDTATSGIWRPVYLESWSTARLARVRPVVSVETPDDGSRRGLVRAGVQVEGAGAEAGELSVRVTVAGQTAQAAVAGSADETTVDLKVPHVDLWWPRGYGAQPRYDLRVELVDGERVIDTWNRRIGFRTARLDMEPDDAGTGFQFVVNDVPIHVRGANWIPDDAFPTRVDRARYAARLDQAEFANLNLLRVWGGGIYEAEDFFDLCDERGILTWQDFLFACAAYAEEDPLHAEIEAEAREHVVRLMSHPSLILWNGSNENIWGFHDWRWKGRLEGRTWGLGYYTELLPNVVAELDPGRSYTPSSPWSGSMDVHPNDTAHGSMHIWDLWNQRDYPAYREYRPRFVAEYGWQGPPTWSTLRRSISDAPLTPESPGMQVHQKAANGNDKLTDGLVAHLPMPNETEDWHWAMQLNQATAVAFAIEHFRSLAPHNTGQVVWQLNDCWPVTSWAAVDGDGRAKPLLFALAHANADRLVTIQPRESGLVVSLSNETDSAWDGELVLSRRAFGGDVLAQESVPVHVPARGTVAVPVPDGVASAGQVGAEVLVATLGDVRGLWFYAEYRDSELGEAQLRTEVTRTGDGYDVHVTADSLVRDLTLLVDKVDPAAAVDDALLTLLPGESVRLRVRSAVDLDPEALVGPKVLRSANQLLHPARVPVAAGVAG